jgi:hypothetical protein
VNIGEFVQAGGEVDRSAAVSDFDLAPEPVHVEEDEQVDRAIALVLTIVALKLAPAVDGRGACADIGGIAWSLAPASGASKIALA